MKLSTKGRYGLRAVLDMALHKSEGPITLNSIAERQGISEGYLEQLMMPLKRAGLVKSVRGAQGGYVLAKEPKDITVGEVIRALEGPIAPVACVSEDYPEECERAEGCVTRLVWAKVRDSIAEVLDSFTLEDLVQESRKHTGQSSYMYYI
uniref:RrF2 family transcriptional regulator n=1 Tax=Thermacetogenium phaeum TaxID=85874 RepID=UPI00048EAA05|nr:Rrf2 family transcriptional regulator [Thermacetogenium phaeum]